MTEWEQQVCELAIRWREAKYSVEEALLRQELTHAIDMLKKERRDAKVEESKTN